MIYLVIVSTKDAAISDGAIVDSPAEAKTVYNALFDKYQTERITIFKMSRKEFYGDILNGFKLSSFISDATIVNPFALDNEKTV